MSLRYKNIIYTLILFLAMFLVWKYRQSQQQIPLVVFTGKTMGPITYTIKYFDEKQRNFKKEVDSLLVVFNNSLNTYQPASEISQFNKDSVFKFDLPYFLPVLQNARQINGLTSGAFDPTVMPLVNAWGFGPDKNMHRDSTYIDSLMQFVGFDKIGFDGQGVWKLDSRSSLDFSASAKGYGIDVVFNYLKNKSLKNLYVEIGGEVRAGGKNLETSQPWQVGVLNPNSDEINQFAIAVVSLQDQAMATSGNYFNYHIIDGVKYSHTISPFTGYPIVHPLLSATVFAPDCMSADALATAFMVMGNEKAIEFLNKNDQYEAFLVFSDSNGNLSTYSTADIAPFIKILD